MVGLGGQLRYGCPNVSYGPYSSRVFRKNRQKGFFFFKSAILPRFWLANHLFSTVVYTLFDVAIFRTNTCTLNFSAQVAVVMCMGRSAGWYSPAAANLQNVSFVEKLISATKDFCEMMGYLDYKYLVRFIYILDFRI